MILIYNKLNYSKREIIQLSEILILFKRHLIKSFRIIWKNVYCENVIPVRKNIKIAYR